MSGGAPHGFRQTRAEALDSLRGADLDVLIIGGGINGAGIARDLTLRAKSEKAALRVGLVDQGHFSSGTSGRNSQLIHGGLRYLENLEFGLVQEALHERETLLRIAPHLVEPLPMLIPYYGAWKRVYFGAGLAVYDLLAGRRNIGRRTQLSAARLREIEPEMASEGLHSAAIYYDCKVHSARLVLENLFDASRNGAAVTNYVRVMSWRRDGEWFHARLEDRRSGEEFAVRARQLVDARGPWEGSANLRLVRGSHIIVPRVNRGNHAIAHFNDDGRILFVIPWGADGRLSLVGTTDVDHRGTPDDARISTDEVAYLQRATARIFPRAALEPLAAYASLRPLVSEPGKSATATSRSHRIWMDDGVLKISGGKYTTYRIMSEQAVDLLRPDWKDKSRTAIEPLGAKPPAGTPAVARFHPAAALEALGGAPCELDPWESAIIAFAARHEMAQRLPDLLFVSTYWGHERTWSAGSLAPYARELGRWLGWDAVRVEEEVDLALRVAGLPAARAR